MITPRTGFVWLLEQLLWEPPEASAMSGRASASQLQNRPTTDQGWAHQWQWKHLWDNIFTKGNKVQHNISQERGMRRCKRNSPANTSKGKGECVPRVCGGCFPWKGAQSEAEECEESSPWGESNDRDNGWWNYWNPHCPSPCAAGDLEVEKSGVKLSPGKRGPGGRCFLRFGFISHYPTLIGNYLR